MKKISVLALTILFINFKGNCQITKTNWLIGGNGTFVANKTTYEGLNTTGKLINFIIKPNIGYFFADKFAAGLKLGLEHYNYILGSNKSVATNYLFGPFARYYFLSSEKQINLFLEGDYEHQIDRPSKQSANRFSFFAGPVFYFNESVGLEFTVGYSTTNSVQTKGNKSILMGLGIQFHLEKDK